VWVDRSVQVKCFDKALCVWKDHIEFDLWCAVGHVMTVNIRMKAHRLLGEDDLALLFVGLFSENGRVYLARGLVVVKPALDEFLGNAVLTELGEFASRCLCGGGRRTTSAGFFLTNRCLPFLHPSILRNSSNSRTLRLQQRYPCKSEDDGMH